MFSAETYTKRRTQLANEVSNGLLLVAGNNHSPKNYSANTYPFRQDSNFLYFAGIDLPGIHLTIDTSTGKSTLYGDDISVESAIWTGTQPKLIDWANKVGIDNVKPARKLGEDIRHSTKIHFLPSYPHDRKIWLSEILGRSIGEVNNGHSLEFIKAVVKQRSKKTLEEVEQIEDALNRATSKFHVDAMRMAKVGVHEYEIAGHIESTMLKNNCSAAYGIICSVRGEILHNEFYNNQLQNDQLLLIDAGAENPMHYASDITRTSPIGGKFSDRQKAIYSIVLEALNSTIKSLEPGVVYQNAHFNAAKIICSGLKEIGLMKGEVDEAVNAGAHALFYPHGLGHMIGLDVHDMEDLGEDNVGYDENVRRSKQFGAAYLRLGRELQEGFVITVEPGIYFIPNLIEKWKSEKRFDNFINYPEAEKYLNFGGIRIEDNILITDKAGKVLGKPIPKSIEEIERLF